MKNSNVFDEMGYYWLEIANQSQTQRQLQFLQNNITPSNGFILDLACGTGRHSTALSEKGYFMVGLDLSTKLLKISKQRSSATPLVRGDMRYLPFKAESFAAAISMDTSIGYLPSEKDDLQSLIEVRRVLRQNCLLILDVFNKPNITAKYQGKTISPQWREYPSFFLLQERKVSDYGDLLIDFWTVQDKVNGEPRVFEHVVRLYDAENLQGLLKKAGFTVKKSFGDYEKQKYKAESPRLIILAS